MSAGATPGDAQHPGHDGHAGVLLVHADPTHTAITALNSFTLPSARHPNFTSTYYV